jgi:hypothetical protein
VRTDADAHNILTVEVKDGSQIILDPYRVDRLFIEGGELMDFVGTQTRIKGVPLEKSKGSLR